MKLRQSSPETMLGALLVFFIIQAAGILALAIAYNRFK